MCFLTISFQTDVCAEVKVLSQLHHKHLVNLCGYCEEKGENIELAITVLCIWIIKLEIIQSSYMEKPEVEVLCIDFAFSQVSEAESQE